MPVDLFTPKISPAAENLSAAGDIFLPFAVNGLLCETKRKTAGSKL